MILLLFLIIISLEAIYEGLDLISKNYPDRGYKLWSGVFEFVYRVIVMLIIFLWIANYHFSHIYSYHVSFWHIFGGFILLRFALFDIIYNLIIGEPIFYVGSTKIYDKIWSWFFRWSGIPRDHFFAMFKLIALVISITWLIP